MNINLFNMRPLLRELKGLRTACERIADALEADLDSRDIHMRTPKATGTDEPSVAYVDEEMDWARENIARLKREEEALAQEAREDV